MISSAMQTGLYGGVRLAPRADAHSQPANGRPSKLVAQLERARLGRSHVSPPFGTLDTKKGLTEPSNGTVSFFIPPLRCQVFADDLG